MDLKGLFISTRACILLFKSGANAAIVRGSEAVVEFESRVALGCRKKLLTWLCFCLGWRISMWMGVLLRFSGGLS
jgi:hypothetical protein